jgi:hypothetical protein
MLVGEADSLDRAQRGPAHWPDVRLSDGQQIWQCSARLRAEGTDHFQHVDAEPLVTVASRADQRG